MRQFGYIFFFSFLILLVVESSHGQLKRDPRMVGMGNAYTTLADGVYAVGVNPANLAFQQDKPFMLQLSTINFGFVNNFFSFENYSLYNGANLEKNNQELKRGFYDMIGDNLRLTTDMHLSIPMMNYSSGNMAITSDIMVVGDLGLPTDLFRFILDGNPVNHVYDLTLKYEVLGLAEYAFSFAVPYNKFALGVSFKYLQGMFYLGVDPDSSFATEETNFTQFNAQGRYYIRQGIGGNGFGLDIGFSTADLNGWKIGASIINLLGTINWNRPSGMKDLLGVSATEGIFSWGGDPVTDGSAMVFEFSIDSVNAASINEESFDKNFKTEKMVVLDTTASGEPRVFSIRYPAMFRFGVSRQIDPDFLVESDLIAGFDDRLFVQRQWKWATGVRFTRFPGFPLRLGFTYGGRYLKELGMGFGLQKGPLIFDFALQFRNGFWFHNMQGISFSAGVALTGFRGRGE